MDCNKTDGGSGCKDNGANNMKRIKYHISDTKRNKRINELTYTAVRLAKYTQQIAK